MLCPCEARRWDWLSHLLRSHMQLVPPQQAFAATLRLTHSTEDRRQRERGRKERKQPSLSPICPPAGPDGASLSVRTQVTAILAKPQERRHFMSPSHCYLASVKIRKGDKRKASKSFSRKGHDWQGRLKSGSSSREKKASANLLCRDEREAGVLCAPSVAPPPN